MSELHLLAGLLACLVWLALTPGASAQEQKRGFLDRVHKDAAGKEWKYVLFVPHDYQGDKPYPLLLFLHGLGECGTDGRRQAEVGLGPAVKKREKTFPFLVVFPQAARPEQDLRQTWHAGKPEGDKALAILAKVQAEYRLDPKQICLTGLSMGGYGTWALAGSFPDRWAAIAPVCGGGDPQLAPKIRQIPCWCFHGERDAVVPARESRRMIDALKTAGGEPRYDEYPGVEHNSWDKAYGTEELYEWLLRQRLK